MRKFFSSVLLAAATVTAPVTALAADSVSYLDNTQPWSVRMAESEMVRFPEAWMIDWDEEPQWDYVHGLNLLAFSKLY